MEKGVLTVFLRGFGLLLLAGVLGTGIATVRYFSGERPHWSSARWDSAGSAPDPTAEREAIIQVYGARAWGWRGIFGMHTWIAIKRENAPIFERYEVVGFGVSGGARAVRRNRYPVDAYWAGNAPVLLGEIRGERAAAAIPRLIEAVDAYPYDHRYTIWPGPNSNSFTAFVLRRAGGIGIELPPLAVGKDYIGQGRWYARAPSGTGFQFSMMGLIGMTIAADEGLEINLLGLTFGVDFTRPALKLPGLGRIGLS
ncbi:MAG: DUF3750 domain-containing protein [Geminicoccaceae bacterium]|nr:DUF3750 domain-containing protein [Geminicoccaceae bacterium]MCB9943317.1 DUF3750 domain-containing protein [Geminicoccaceae bacterium]